MGTVNNKGNWTGSEQNVSVLDMVILSHRCGEAERVTDPERSWQAALKGGLRNDPPFQMALRLSIQTLAVHRWTFWRPPRSVEDFSASVSRRGAEHDRK